MENYRYLGQEAVISVLPKKRVGAELSVGQFIQQEPYLRSSNCGSHEDRFNGNSIERFTTPDGGTEILTLPSSPYVESSDSTHMMLVALNQDKRGKEKAVPTFTDFSDGQGTAHFNILAQLAPALSRRYGRKWFIGTSINPHEWGRQAVQTVKTIHTHIIGMQGEQFVPFTEIGHQERADRRRIIADGTTNLGIGLLRDMVFTQDFWSNPEFEGLVTNRDVRSGNDYPKGYTFAIPDSSALADPRFFALTRAIDEKIAKEYKGLSGIFAQGSKKDNLGRPLLRPTEERSLKLSEYLKRNAGRLTDETSQRLLRLSALIRPAEVEIALAGSEEEKVIRKNTRLFLIGPAYNQMIYPAQDGSGEIHVTIVPRSLSGGSPLDAMGIYKEQFIAPHEVMSTITAGHKKVAQEITHQAFEPAEITFEEPVEHQIFPMQETILPSFAYLK